MYDNGRESDSILQLRIIEEWISKFRREMNNLNSDTQKGSRKNRQRRFRRPDKAELEWCRERCLDFTILKEVAFLAEEI